MPNFANRPLSGSYQGNKANRLADYRKINNSFLEIAKDVADFEQRLAALEASTTGTLSDLNFEENSIDGSVLLENSIPGSKIVDGGITADKLVSDSYDGITDANVAPGANIAISKIAVSGIQHSQLIGIGSNTHAQIDSLLTDLQTLSNTISSQITSLTSDVAAMVAYVHYVPLTTTAPTIAPAINELKVSIDALNLQDLDYLSRHAVAPVTSANYTEPPFISGYPDVSGILDGERFIVATPAAGDWYGHSADIPIFHSGDPSWWTYDEPDENTIAYVQDEHQYRQYAQGAWTSYIPISSIFTEHLYVAEDTTLPTTGSGIIPSGENYTFVSADVTERSQIFLTAKGNNIDTPGLKWKNPITASGFDVYTKTEAMATDELSFGWLLIN